jgi:hypothetical protein
MRGIVDACNSLEAHPIGRMIEVQLPTETLEMFLIIVSPINPLQWISLVLS